MVRQALLSLTTASLLGALPPEAPAQSAGTDFAPKSPATATTLSLLGTVVPTALGAAMLDGGGSGAGWLLFYGVYFGPSTGYFYAGRAGRGFGGAAIRLGFAAGTVFGIMAACGGDVIWGCEDESAANVVALVGLGLITMSAVHDIVRAGPAAREWNARQQSKRVSLRPRVDPVRRSGGLELRLRF